MERAAQPQLDDPADDVVGTTDAPSFGSRVDPDGQIQTEGYRRVLTALSRHGGATIGLAGTRGIGKSELLRTFCADRLKPPSVAGGGTIGIIVPAPVAYDSQAFLRVLIRRLAEAVPDYDQAGRNRRFRALSPAELAVLAVAVMLVVAGVLLALGLTPNERHALGWALIGAGGALALWRSGSWLRATIAGWRTHPVRAQGSAQADELADRLSADRRRQLARQAHDVVTGVRYVETRSQSSEASAAVKGLGLTMTSGLNLDQVPLTEADLVAMLDGFVAELHQAGYQVRIGIDELDKLEAGDDAVKFLTGIKVLFTIRDCSFLLTISEDASAQFARRGMAVRDVFDSSLDDVITLRPLTYLEARRLVRNRHGADAASSMSDSQILLCHSMSGGLPREFLRYCRQLGEVSDRAGAGSSLAEVAQELIGADVRGRLDGLRAALRGRDEGDAGANLVAELEQVEEDFAAGRTLDGLAGFLAGDSGFRELCLGPPPGDLRVAAPAEASGSDWIRDARRQVYAYLFLMTTMREAFRPGSLAAGATELLPRYDVLRDARCRLETDPAAGWRRTAEARRMLGLPVPLPPSATVVVAPERARSERATA
jgi:hypothetical protein